MKAIQLVRFGDASQAFEIREVPLPEFSDRQILIKVESFGLNFADVMARRGFYKAIPPMPCILGYEVAGKVEELGTQVTDLKKGDRVVAFSRFGGYAEYLAANPLGAIKISDGISASKALTLPTQYSTACHAAYELANIRAGETVLIHAAAGGVGIALVQLAKRRNCRVIGTVGSEEKVPFIESLGVDWAIHYRQNDFAAEVKRLVPGGKVDAVFDRSGGRSFNKGRRLLNAGGRIVGYGVSDQLGRRPGTLSRLRLIMEYGFMNPASVLVESQGILGLNMLKLADTKPEIIRDTLRKVADLLEAGEIEPVVGKEYPAAEIASAHEYFESRRSIGKIVMHW